MAAIELTGISKRYNIYDRPVDRLKELLSRNRRSFHKEYWSLRDIDLAFEAGTTTAVLGPNGSGKSTLLQIMAKVLQPTTGSVQINGRLTAILELGAGFQLDYSGRENIILYAMILGITQEEILARMDEIIEFAEIGDFFDHPVKTYSSGMIVRLAFAAAISVDPEILLIDEALAVGDMRFQKKCRDKIKSLQARGKTILLVSHNMNAINRFCEKAVLLNGGRIVNHGSLEEIIPQYEELMSDSGQVAPKVFTPPVAIF